LAKGHLSHLPKYGNFGYYQVSSDKISLLSQSHMWDELIKIVQYIEALLQSEIWHSSSGRLHGVIRILLLRYLGRPPEAPTYVCQELSHKSDLKSAIICGSNPLFWTGMLKITWYHPKWDVGQIFLLTHTFVPKQWLEKEMQHIFGKWLMYNFCISVKS